MMCYVFFLYFVEIGPDFLERSENLGTKILRSHVVHPIS